MKKVIFNFFKGIMIGVANIIPGVSGGTIAVVLGIFDQLIESINNFYKDLRKYLPFLIPIGLGAVTGIILFSSLIKYALEKYSFPTSMFFVGLVVGSIPFIYKRAVSRGFKVSYLVPLAIAFLAVVGLSLTKAPTSMNTAYNVDFMLILKCFFGGVVASCAMVIPGISGSFTLMLLGLYPIVIDHVAGIKEYLALPSNFALLFQLLKVIAPIGIGTIIGIFLISGIIESLLSKFYSVTYFVILGLIFGSIFGIFNDPITYASGLGNLTLLIGVVMGVLGFVVSIIFGKTDA